MYREKVHVGVVEAEKKSYLITSHPRQNPLLRGGPWAVWRGGNVAALPQVPEYECRVLWEIARRSSESHAHSYTTPARLLSP